MAEIDEQEAPFDAVSITNYGRITDRLRADIVRGRLLPGTRLKMQELCATYRVSASPIREALQQLQVEGLVVLSPNRGATVRMLDRHQVIETFRLREALEGFQASELAKVAEPAQLAELRAAAEGFAAAARDGDYERSSPHNRVFHRIINAHDDNREVLTVLTRQDGLSSFLRRQLGLTPTRFAEAGREHFAIVDAIAAGDADAAGKLAGAHVRSTLQDILARLEAGAEGASGVLDPS